MNYEGKTVSELVEMRDELSAAIKGMKDEAKATKVADAESREASARANDNLKAGARVSFMFKGEAVEGGLVLRVSEKSITVESEVFSKGKGYRKYSEIVEVASATEEDTE